MNTAVLVSENFTFWSCPILLFCSNVFMYKRLLFWNKFCLVLATYLSFLMVEFNRYVQPNAGGFGCGLAKGNRGASIVREVPGNL